MQRLNLSTPDSVGYVPLPGLIGTNWKHSGNGYVYTIIGFGWDGERDRWMLTHIRAGTLEITYHRTPQNFFGMRLNGDTRYTLVHNDG